MIPIGSHNVRHRSLGDGEEPVQAYQYWPNKFTWGPLTCESEDGMARPHAHAHVMWGIEVTLVVIT